MYYVPRYIEIYRKGVRHNTDKRKKEFDTHDFHGWRPVHRGFRICILTRGCQRTEGKTRSISYIEISISIKYRNFRSEIFDIYFDIYMYRNFRSKLSIRYSTQSDRYSTKSGNYLRTVSINSCLLVFPNSASYLLVSLSILAIRYPTQRGCHCSLGNNVAAYFPILPTYCYCYCCIETLVGPRRRAAYSRISIKLQGWIEVPVLIVRAGLPTTNF